MDISFDSNATAIYIKLENKDIDRTISFDNGIIDISKDNKIVGIEYFLY